MPRRPLGAPSVAALLVTCSCFVRAQSGNGGGGWFDNEEWQNSRGFHPQGLTYTFLPPSNQQSYEWPGEDAHAFRGWPLRPPRMPRSANPDQPEAPHISAPVQSDYPDYFAQGNVPFQPSNPLSPPHIPLPKGQ